MPLVRGQEEDNETTHWLCVWCAAHLDGAGVGVGHFDVEPRKHPSGVAGLQRHAEAFAITHASCLATPFLSFSPTPQNRALGDYAVQSDRTVERFLGRLVRHGTYVVGARRRRRRQNGEDQEAKPWGGASWSPSTIAVTVSIWLALTGASGATSPGTDDGRSAVSVNVQTYEVSASSFARALEILSENALLDGRHAIAATQIVFDPAVSYAEGEGGCSVARVEVVVRATITMPAWRQIRFVRAEERAAWDRLIARVRRHEDVHVAIARMHAEELADALFSLPAATTCEALDVEVGRAQTEMLVRHGRAQNDFDRQLSAN